MQATLDDPSTAPAARPRELDRDRVAELMAALAAGDAAAAVTLAHEFGGPISARLRRHLARLAARQVARDDLGGLLLDACLELRDCAGAWDPAHGVLPWVWADRRLFALCSRFVGQHADALDDATPRVVAVGATGVVVDGGQGTSVEAAPLDVLATLAVTRDDAALVYDALERVGSPRDRDLLLEYTLQQAAGDPSPAVTVARQFGLQAPTVRQAVRRMRVNLRALAERDERFAPLTDLPLVA